MLLGVIWTYWMSVGLMIGIVTVVVAVIVGYLRKVVRPKYPPRGYVRN